MSTTVLGRRLGGERRLESLPLGTELVLSSGKIATLVACTFTRAVVRLDTGAEIAIAPGAELEILEPVSHAAESATPRGRHADVASAAEAGAVPRPVAEAPECLQRPSNGGQENASDAAGRPRAHPPPSDASGIALEGLGRTPCPTCGARFTRQRPWQRHCSRRCRQRAYDRAHRAASTL